MSKQTTISVFGHSVVLPVDGSKDLLILNEEEINKKFKTSHTPSPFSIETQIPIGENFYYCAEHYDSTKIDSELLYFEEGFAELYKKRTRYYIKREIICYYGSGRSRSNKSRSNPKAFKDFENTGILIVKSLVPKNIFDFFCYPHSVLCSADLFRPCPVELEEQTLLGRLDGRIQSIDSSELRTILGDQNIIDAVESTNKPFSLQSKVVDLVETDSRVTAGILNARPRSNKPARPQRGSIVYNDKTNRFEGYDGTAWRPLKWGDE